MEKIIGEEAIINMPHKWGRNSMKKTAMIKAVDPNGKLLKDTRDSLRLTTNMVKEMQS
jgi:hypothetical protein